MKYFATLITLLRDRKSFLDDIRRNIRLEHKIVSLFISSSIFLAIYGAIIGSSSSWLQSISSAIKLPALYLITLVICLPTLYFFDILFGSALLFPQYVALILTTVSIISVLLFSFAPVILFFLISIPDYSFFLLINVAVFCFTGIIGVKLFYQGMLSINPPQTESIPIQDSSDDFVTISRESEHDRQKMRKRLLQFWLILYGLVGSQLGWTLRPFFGAPDQPFQLFRPEIEGNFYSTVLQTFWTFLGF